jgi:uncharacterized membrane protein
MSLGQRLRFNLRLADALSLGAVVLGAAATVAVYQRLPDRIATHFDITGRADAWSSRAFGASILPAIGAGTWLIVRFGGRLVPASWRARYAASPMAELACAVLLLLLAMHVLILRAALDGTPHIGGGLTTLLGVTWIAFAIFLPRVRRNPFVGIRTPWSIVSDENWARTHRFASYTFGVGGLVALIAAAIGGPAAVAVALVVTIVSALVPAAYSWRLAMRRG